MSGLYSKYITPIHRWGDIILLNISFFLAYYFLFEDFRLENNKNYLFFLLFNTISFLASAYILQIYKIHRVTRISFVVINIIKLLFLNTLFNQLFIESTSLELDLTFRITNKLLFGLLILVWRLGMIYALKVYRRSGYNYRRVIIAGYGETSIELEDFFINHPEHGYHFLGYFDDNAKAINNLGGKISDIEEFVKKHQIDEIYCLMSRLSSEQMAKLIEFSETQLLRIKFLPESIGFNYKKLKIDFYDHLPVLILTSLPLDNIVNHLVKRLFDIIFSLLILIFLLSWLFPLLAILIKIDSKGPVLFKQKRTGMKNKDFWCLKFRTMKVNQDSEIKQAVINDPRITPLGSYLRKTSLDEFPQFLNVLMGDMSVVGPRPHMIKHTEEYSKLIDKYMVRHWVKPGITGLSQVKGFRGETTDPLLMKKRIRTDIFYLENWTFLLDLKIIALTIFNTLKGDKQAF